MRIERLAGLALAAALSTGCVSTSITRELHEVETLTHLRVATGLDREQVETESNDAARRELSSMLDADAAVRIALLNNRSLRATLRELGIARGRLVQAGLLPNPAIEVEWSPERESRAELRLEYDITSALLAPLRSGAARADLDAARYRAAATVVRTGFEVRAAFYAVSAADERLGVATRALDTFAAARDAARALVAAGNGTPLDAATEEAGYQQARLTVARLELERLRTRERLNRLLGLHGGETQWSVLAPLRATPDAATPTATERRAIEASLELAEMRGTLEAAARRAGLSRAQGWLPDVSIDVHALYAEPGAVGAEREPWRIGAGLRFTLPVFDRRQGLVAAYVAEFDGLIERYVGLAIDVRSAVREARAAVQSAQLQSREYDRVLLPARAEVTAQTLLQYNAMQLGVFQLLQARRAQLDAELAAIESRREFWTANAALEALLAGTRVEIASASGTQSFGSATNAEGGH